MKGWNTGIMEAASGRDGVVGCGGVGLRDWAGRGQAQGWNRGGADQLVPPLDQSPIGSGIGDVLR